GGGVGVGVGEGDAEPVTAGVGVVVGSGEPEQAEVTASARIVAAVSALPRPPRCMPSTPLFELFLRALCMRTTSRRGRRVDSCRSMGPFTTLLLRSEP